MVTLEALLPLLGPQASSEEKIAALLVLPQIFQVDDRESVRKVFEAIDFKYLRRLLNSKGIDHDEHHEVALNVLSVFAMDQELAGTKQIRGCLDSVVALSASSIECVASEALDLLLRLLVDGSACQAIVQSPRVECLIDAFVKASRTHLQNDRRSKVHSLLATAVAQQPPSLGDAQGLLTAIAAYIQKQQDWSKFELLHLLGQILQYVAPPQGVSEPKELYCINLEPVLVEVLRAKGAPPVIVHNALQAASSWLCLFGGRGIASPEAWMVLMNAAVVELLLLLHQVDPQFPVEERLDPVQQALLAATCQIIEVLLERLVTEKITLTYEQLNSWRRQCGDLVMALAEVLAHIGAHFPENPARAEQLCQSPWALALVRLICQFLCDLDDEVSAKAARGVLPVLRALEDGSVDTPIDVMPFVGPCLDRILSDPTIIKEHHLTEDDD